MRHRASDVFLCLVPFVVAGAAGPRALRIPGVHQVFGGVLCAAIAAAAWVVGARAIGSGDEARRRLALAGSLLLAPWALVALLWVGLGTPWDATPEENVMRYLVLLAGAVAVTVGCVFAGEALAEGGERIHSTLGFAAGLLAGAAYLVWLSFQVGVYAVRVRTGQAPSPAVVAMSDVIDTLLFIACVLTYLATAAFAASFGRARWLGPGAAGAYLAVSLVALFFIVVRGIAFPDPAAGTTPWYTQPGFIAGIPAVPWIMPSLLGVVLLRRAGAGRA